LPQTITIQIRKKSNHDLLIPNLIRIAATECTEAYSSGSLAQPMPRSHLILLGCFASMHQIAQRLGTPSGTRPPSDPRIDSNMPAFQHPADPS
jgi:hypothetical protein